MKSFLKKLGPILNDGLIILGVFSLIFLVANLVAMRALQKKDRSQPPEDDRDLFSYCYNIEMPEAIKALDGAFDEATIQHFLAVNAETNALRLAPHPTLHYIEASIHGRYFHVGVENVRYLPGWTDEQVEAMLHDRSKPLILTLGGSTTLGEGVADGETIAAYLQKMVGDRANVVNFGTGGYDQTREIDRLDYLLRHGIRPSAVLFLDGLNDIRNIVRSNYREGDKVMYRGFAAGKGDVTRGDKAFTLAQQGSFRPKDFVVMLVQALPVTRYFIELRKSKLDPAKIPLVIDPFRDRYDYAEMEYLFFNSASRADAHVELFTGQLVRYYVNDVAFIKGLGTAFGFKTAVFYQPQGLLDPSNVLRGNPPPDVLGSRYFRAADQTVRDGIRNGTLQMIDLSGILADISARRRAYVDGMHYSPEANERIASHYLRFLQDSQVVPK